MDERMAVGRFAGLEGVRGIAASSVVVFHVWLYRTNAGSLPVGHHLDGVLSHFWLGVDAFFVLSGFLLYRPFVHAAVQATGSVDLARYARARLLRILPAYWAALTLIILWTRSDLRGAAASFLAVVGLCVAALLCERSEALGRVVVTGVLALCAASIAVLGTAASLSPSFDSQMVTVARNYLLLNTQQSRWVIVPAWTLALEAAFYVALPVFAAVAARLSARHSTVKRRALGQVPLLVALVAIAETYRFFDHLYGLPILLPGYLDLFALGMAVAIFYEVRPRVSGLVRAALAVAAVGVFAGASLVEHRSTWSLAYGPLAGLAFAMLVVVIVCGPRRRTRFTTRALTAAGTVSYGIYLWHWALVNQLFYGDLRGLRPHSFVLEVLITLALAAAIAAVSWEALERRVLKLKDRPLPSVDRAPVPAAAALSTS